MDEQPAVNGRVSSRELYAALNALRAELASGQRDHIADGTAALTATEQRLGARIDRVEATLNAHDDLLQQLKGAKALLKEWRYYRCRGCSASAVVADTIESELCARIAEAVLPADIVELAREDLRKRLALPRDGDKLRRRLDQRRERLSQLFAWGDLTEAEYRRQKTEVERDLALLPDDDKLVLFDHHRRLMINMAENVAAATPQQLRELILMLVEHAETRDRGLGAVRWTGPARPFFSVVGVAPPDGLGGARTTHRAGLVHGDRMTSSDWQL